MRVSPRRNLQSHGLHEAEGNPSPVRRCNVLHVYKVVALVEALHKQSKTDKAHKDT